MRKRFVVAPSFLAGLLYFFSHLYPWTRNCVVKGFPLAAADASASHGVSSPSVVGPRSPFNRIAWCLGLSLDRLNPFPPDRGHGAPVLLPSGSLSPSSGGKDDPHSGVPGDDP
jgi:hypothetical protein